MIYTQRFWNIETLQSELAVFIHMLILEILHLKQIHSFYGRINEFILETSLDLRFQYRSAIVEKINQIVTHLYLP